VLLYAHASQPVVFCAHLLCSAHCASQLVPSNFTHSLSTRALTFQQVFLMLHARRRSLACLEDGTSRFVVPGSISVRSGSLAIGFSQKMSSIGGIGGSGKPQMFGLGR